MKIENIEIDKLKPYKRNARIHSKKQIDLLAQNIVKFGFTTPVLIDEKNNIIAGHGRLEAMKQLKGKNIPCVRMENLTKEEVRALRLADNKIAEMGEWDLDLAIEEIKGLNDDLIGLSGFDLEKISKIAEVEEIDFDNIKGNEEREKQFKEELINCPHCNKSFKIQI